MTYAAHSGALASGPAGPLIDQFGPVYLDWMRGGAAAPRVFDDISSPKLAADAPSVGGPFCSEWWE